MTFCDLRVAGLRARGHRRVATLDDAAQLVHDIAGPGDYVVCLGAGNIKHWAYALPGELKGLG
jgi:UDP-N-acetylmuramate--alanine ligase